MNNYDLFFIPVNKDAVPLTCSREKRKGRKRRKTETGNVKLNATTIGAGRWLEDKIMAVQNKKILTSKQEIRDYVGCSWRSFKRYAESGFPALYEEGRWIAHTDNIDEFFRKYTFRNMKSVLKDIPDNLN